MTLIIDKIFANVTRLIAILVLLIVAWIFTVLIQESLTSINAFGFDFITQDKWAPNLEKFGGYAAIMGSVISTFMAMVLAVPPMICFNSFLTHSVRQHLLWVRLNTK